MDPMVLCKVHAHVARFALLEAFEQHSAVMPDSIRLAWQTALEAVLQAEEELLTWKPI